MKSLRLVSMVLPPVGVLATRTIITEPRPVGWRSRRRRDREKSAPKRVTAVTILRPAGQERLGSSRHRGTTRTSVERRPDTIVF